MTWRRAESPDRVFSLKIEGPASEVAVSAACSRLFECMQILREQVCAAHRMMLIPAIAVIAGAVGIAVQKGGTHNFTHNQKFL